MLLHTRTREKQTRRILPPRPIIIILVGVKAPHTQYLHTEKRSLLIWSIPWKQLAHPLLLLLLHLLWSGQRSGARSSRASLHRSRPSACLLRTWTHPLRCIHRLRRLHCPLTQCRWTIECSRRRPHLHYAPVSVRTTGVHVSSSLHVAATWRSIAGSATTSTTTISLTGGRLSISSVRNARKFREVRRRKLVLWTYIPPLCFVKRNVRALDMCACIYICEAAYLSDSIDTDVVCGLAYIHVCISLCVHRVSFPTS